MYHTGWEGESVEVIISRKDCETHRECVKYLLPLWTEWFRRYRRTGPNRRGPPIIQRHYGKRRCHSRVQDAFKERRLTDSRTIAHTYHMRLFDFIPFFLVFNIYVWCNFLWPPVSIGYNISYSGYVSYEKAKKYVRKFGVKFLKKDKKARWFYQYLLSNPNIHYLIRMKTYRAFKSPASHVQLSRYQELHLKELRWAKKYDEGAGRERKKERNIHRASARGKVTRNRIYWRRWGCAGEFLKSPDFVAFAIRLASKPRLVSWTLQNGAASEKVPRAHRLGLKALRTLSIREGRVAWHREAIDCSPRSLRRQKKWWKCKY